MAANQKDPGLCTRSSAELDEPEPRSGASGGLGPRDRHVVEARRQGAGKCVYPAAVCVHREEHVLLKVHWVTGGRDGRDWQCRLPTGGGDPGGLRQGRDGEFECQTHSKIESLPVVLSRAVAAGWTWGGVPEALIFSVKLPETVNSVLL